MSDLWICVSSNPKERGFILGIKDIIHGFMPALTLKSFVFLQFSLQNLNYANLA